MVKFTAPTERIVHGPGKMTNGVTDGVTVEVTDAERRILNEKKLIKIGVCLYAPQIRYSPNS